MLERGRIAERWRSERWDSLRLLTPNWMTRLPGQPYDGPDPDGFTSAGRLVARLEHYAAGFAAPVLTNTTVLDLSADSAANHRYRVVTDHGTWRARSVVIATGPYGIPHVPAGLDTAEVVTANRYRNPAQLSSGAVLVIGASASGVQIADELNRAGREVVLAVGRHTRMPRAYRGMDIFWWLDRTGRLARTVDDGRDPSVARREPSMQLIGRRPRHDESDDDADIDLFALQARGVRLAGRLDGAAAGRARFRPDLADTSAAADRAMHRVLDAIDRHIDEVGLDAEVLPRRRPSPLPLPAPVRDIDLASADISTVVVATGYRAHFPWLRLPITDPDGSIRQYRGVTTAPGVYVVGQRFQHRRDSTFIDGARHDAKAVVAHLLGDAPPRELEQLDEEPAA